MTINKLRFLILIFMNRKEKAIKILSKIESLQHYYCKYVLYSKGELSLIDWLENNPNTYITMINFEWKAYHKLYPIATMKIEKLEYKTLKDLF